MSTTLERVIHWKPDGSGVEIAGHPAVPRGQSPAAPARVERAWIAGTHLGDGVLERFEPGDLVKPAFHYVQSTINEKLEGRASPQLLWDVKRERLGLYIVPDGLIGALWLQFARAVERDSRFRQCAECGDLVRARARHGPRRQAVLLQPLSYQGVPQAPGRGGAPARRGPFARRYRPRP